MSMEDSPLFLQAWHNIDFKVDRIFFYEKPLGKNSIGHFMKKARELLTSQNEKISNHNARKTTITNLSENINPLHVQQINGHKKLESLNHYNTTTMSRKKIFLV